MNMIDTFKTFVADGEPFEIGFTAKGGQDVLRALAIAQAVDEAISYSDMPEWILRRADELLAQQGKEKQ